MKTKAIVLALIASTALAAFADSGRVTLTTQPAAPSLPTTVILPDTGKHEAVITQADLKAAGKELTTTFSLDRTLPGKRAIVVFLDAGDCWAAFIFNAKQYVSFYAPSGNAEIASNLDADMSFLGYKALPKKTIECRITRLSLASLKKGLSKITDLAGPDRKTTLYVFMIDSDDINRFLPPKLGGQANTTFKAVSNVYKIENAIK